MGVPVLIGTSMGHFLSLRYIDGPFFIIGTSMGRKFSITGTAIVDISFSLSSTFMGEFFQQVHVWVVKNCTPWFMDGPDLIYRGTWMGHFSFKIGTWMGDG